MYNTYIYIIQPSRLNCFYIISNFKIFFCFFFNYLSPSCQQRQNYNLNPNLTIFLLKNIQESTKKVFTSMNVLYCVDCTVLYIHIIGISLFTYKVTDSIFCFFFFNAKKREKRDQKRRKKEIKTNYLCSKITMSFENKTEHKIK